MQTIYQEVILANGAKQKHILGTITLKARHICDSEEVAAAPARCTTSGHTAYKRCKICGNIVGEPPMILLPLKHDFQEMPGVAPSCESDGYSSYKVCKRDGCLLEVGKQILPAYNHNKTIFIEEIPATCTLNGQKAKEQCMYCNKYKCPKCGHWITGTICENCNADPNEITQKLDHDFSITVPAKTAVTTSTGTTTGWGAYQACSRPGCNATSGKVIWTNTPKQHSGSCSFTYRHPADKDIAATCEEPGRKNIYRCWHWDCHNCQNRKYTEIPALGHNFTVKVETEELKNVYKRSEKSCTTPASYYYKCENCDKSSKDYTKTYWFDYEDDDAPSGEHDFDTAKVVVEATCTTQGEETCECKTCGFTTVYYIEPNAEKHPKDNGKVTNIIYDTKDILKADCTTAGYEFIHCGHCKKRISTKHQVDAIGVEAVFDPRSTEFYWAKPTGEAALGHEFDESLIESLASEKNISCHDLETELGGKSVLVFCKRCKQPIKQINDNISHDFGEWTLNVQDVVDPVTGATKKLQRHRRICTNCGTIEYGDCKFNFNNKEETVNPTCLSNGYSTYRCTICNLVSKFYSTAEAATGHSWSKDFEITTRAHTKICEKCGKRETTAHTVKQNEDGTSRCTVCNALDKCTHKNTIKLYAKPATCDETGLTVGYKCAVPDCGVITTPQKTVQKLTHEFKAIKEIQAPTCLDDGIELVECALCHNQKLNHERKINKLGHISTILPKIEPSCEAIGWTEGKKCIRCGEIVKPQEIIPALGSHIWANKELDTSCNKCFIKTCSRCNLQEREISQLCTTHITADICEHIVTEPYPGQEATCTTDGWTEGIRCKICKAFINPPEPLTKLGHEFEFKDKRQNTCEVDGHTAGWQCKTCGMIKAGLEITEELKAPGKHNPQYLYVGDGIHTLDCINENCDSYSKITEKCATFVSLNDEKHKCTKCGNETPHDLYESTTRSCTRTRKWINCRLCSFSKNTESISGGDGHSYAAATCTTAKKCTRCGATSGSALGHSYSNATCQRPKTCSRCGATSGGTVGCQKYALTTVRTASCKQSGYSYYACVWCGRKISEINTPAKSHVFKNGKCTGCGKVSSSPSSSSFPGNSPLTKL